MGTSPRNEAGRRDPAEDQRHRLAVEAARLMADEGVRDFFTAKRKAAARLHYADLRHLPSNHEVDLALRERLALFHGEERRDRWARMRREALYAMEWLARFEPRLTGAVLSGTVTAATPIELHARADHPEVLALALDGWGIPCDQRERRLSFGGGRQERVPVFAFRAGEQVIEVTVFDPVLYREPPLDPASGRPMRRATATEVRALPDH